MPAVSKAQRRMMGIASAMQNGDMPMTPGSPAAQIAATQPPEMIDEYARTPEANLPPRRAKVKTVKKHKTKLRRHGGSKKLRRTG